MTEMSKISFEALEEITGGKLVTVANDAVNYANIRHTPGLNGKVAAKVYNGTKLRTTGLKVKKVSQGDTGTINHREFSPYT